MSFLCEGQLLTLKVPSKIAADNTFILLSFEEIRLDVSCDSSARQRIHMKYQVLFYQKNNEKIFKTVICCSLDWRFKGYRSIFFLPMRQSLFCV